MKYKLIILFFIIFSLLLIPAFLIKKQYTPPNTKIKIITTLFPLYDFAKNIVKGKANVYLILPHGTEPHSYEPKFSDIIKINKANILIYTNKYMEPWIEDILKGINNKNLLVIDTSKGINFNYENKQLDPHIWLDISNAKIMANNILNGLINIDPHNKNYYIKNSIHYINKLDSLDKEYTKTLNKRKKHIIISSGHNAFNYLSKKYDFKCIAPLSLSPDSEPSPKKISQIISLIKIHKIKYIYYEELLDPKLAKVISKETGIKLLMLNAAHNIKKSELENNVDYILIMQNNLKNLKIGLECQ